MKKKYIIQIKRYKLWEDLIVYHEELTAKNICFKLRCEGFNVRLIEVFYI